MSEHHLIVNELFDKYGHYKVFPIIYSIKDKLMQYNNESNDLCQLCFINIIDYSDNSDDEHMNINIAILNHLTKSDNSINLLCKKCMCLYNIQDIYILIQKILNLSYHYEGNTRFKEFIELFNDYVTYPYEKLLVEYFSYNMELHYFYHNNCSHYIKLSNKVCDDNILCPLILDIINNIDNLYYIDYLKICPLQYLEILIKKGININYIFDISDYMSNQTVFGNLLYKYLTNNNNNIELRINKLISLGADVNLGNPLRYITGIQYENRLDRIEKIKYLKNIGVNFNNNCIKCSSTGECKTHIMLYDTRLGKLIQQLEST